MNNTNIDGAELRAWRERLGLFDTRSFDAERVALRYLLDLADHRARLHAEGDRQRKQDAVRAAEAALDAACHAEEAAITAWNDAAKARMAAQSTLCNARWEAGL